jgi:hypothetical protein
MENIKAAATAVERNIGVIAANDTEKNVARLTLDRHGLIQDCNPTGAALFKYALGTLVRKHVSILLPQLADIELLQNGEINPQLRFLCRLGRQFEAVNQQGERFATQLFFNVLGSTESAQLSLIVRPVQDASDNWQRPWAAGMGAS